MKHLRLTLPTAAENLALDEALLETIDHSHGGETLRLWEAESPLVVLGRSSRVDEEVDREACRRQSIPVLRRSSGGATIVAGPGCLMYAVVLDLTGRPELRAVDCAHRFVLDRIAAAINAAGCPVARRGVSDLILESPGPRRKFSGNSLRVKRDRLLYHGTLLYGFDLPLVSELLRTPPRQPDYRGGRPHDRFIANLPLSRDALTAAIVAAWSPTRETEVYPAEEVRALVRDRYLVDSWNFSR